MNKIYRIGRDASGKWVVASEFAKGRKKCVARARPLVMAMAASLVVAAAPAVSMATTVDIGAFNPVDNDDKVGATVVGTSSRPAPRPSWASTGAVGPAPESGWATRKTTTT